MNASSPAPEIFLTTNPPEVCASAVLADLKFDLRLHNLPVTKLTLTLPVGNGQEHLVAPGKEGLIQCTRDMDANWTIEKIPAKTADSLTYTLTARQAGGPHKTDHLHFELIDVHVNTMDGKSKITLTTYTDDASKPTGTAVLALEKRKSGVLVNNLRATATKSGEHGTQVWKDKPIRLTWDAQDVEHLLLKQGSESIPLHPWQRSYPDPIDPDAKPLKLTKPTNFTIEARGKDNHKNPQTANANLFLSVYEPDGDYTDLTVTGNMKVVSHKEKTRQYWLNEPLTLTAQDDGYYTITLATFRRLLGVFPPTVGGKCTRSTIKIQNSTFSVVNDSKPITIFAPKDTKLTITSPPLERINDWTKLTKATIAWAGVEPSTTTLPETTQRYNKFPMAKKIPFYAMTVDIEHKKNQKVQFVKKAVITAGNSTGFAFGLNVSGSIACNYTYKYGQAIWLSNDTKAGVALFGGANRSGSGINCISESLESKSKITDIAYWDIRKSEDNDYLEFDKSAPPRYVVVNESIREDATGDKIHVRAEGVTSNNASNDLDRIAYEFTNVQIEYPIFVSNSKRWPVYGVDLARKYPAWIRLKRIGIGIGADGGLHCSRATLVDPSVPSDRRQDLAHRGDSDMLEGIFRPSQFTHSGDEGSLKIYKVYGDMCFESNFNNLTEEKGTQSLHLDEGWTKHSVKDIENDEFSIDGRIRVRSDEVSVMHKGKYEKIDWKEGGEVELMSELDHKSNRTSFSVSNKGIYASGICLTNLDE